MNCIAMIPVHDTAFENHRSPTSEEIDNMRQFIGHYVPQMTHCKRCRADAIGRLCEARSIKAIYSRYIALTVMYYLVFFNDSM